MPNLQNNLNNSSNTQPQSGGKRKYVIGALVGVALYKLFKSDRVVVVNEKPTSSGFMIKLLILIAVVYGVSNYVSNHSTQNQAIKEISEQLPDSNRQTLVKDNKLYFTLKSQILTQADIEFLQDKEIFEIDLSKVKQISEQQLIDIVSLGSQRLNLDGLKNLDYDLASVLIGYKGQTIYLRGLTNLPDNVRKKLEQFSGDISLNTKLYNKVMKNYK